jgi:hypothetical protein
MFIEAGRIELDTFTHFSGERNGGRANSCLRVTSRYDGFLNYGLWFYRGSQFPALQLVWGGFPWEPNFDERFSL